MNESQQRRVLAVMSGEDRSFSASALRAGLRVAEPFYAGVMRARNALYDRGVLPTYDLPLPAIAVGNVTTGGTGKTPVVRWLAEQFIARGLRPAVLTRGYRAEQTAGESDEARMLQNYLGGRASVIADPDRVAGAEAALRQSPPPDVFLLDDAFQHRRAARDFNLVLINAAEPFGHGHVLPRGLLREPLRGLRRADAILLTRADLATPQQLDRIESRLRRYTSAPLFASDHAHVGLLDAEGNARPMDELSRRPFFVFSGIANPASLSQQFVEYGPTFEGSRAFGDHHAYSAGDLDDLRRAAAAEKAELLVTTEKDWVKLAVLPNVREGMPVLRVEMRIRFRDDGEQRLLDLILSRIASRREITAMATPAAEGSAGEAPATDAAAAPSASALATPALATSAPSSSTRPSASAGCPPTESSSGASSHPAPPPAPSAAAASPSPGTSAPPARP